MKSRLFLTLAIAALTSAPAFSVCGLIASVPFSFNAGDQSLAAGEYRLDCGYAASLGVMKLHSTGQRSTMFINTMPQDLPPRDAVQSGEARLVFHRYGDRYFLARVWTPGLEFERKLPTSKTERELAGARIPRETVTLAVRTR
jgi:hypothetical protein